MSSSSIKTLSPLLTYPFDQGVLSPLEQGSKILISGTEYWAGAEDLGEVDVLQNFYPSAQEWANHDVTLLQEIADMASYHAVFCALPKQKEASLYALASALQHLEEGGLLVAMAPNDAGGKRLEKWFSEFGLSATAASKSKCRIVWAQKRGVHQEKIKTAITAGAPQVKTIEGQEFLTQAGIFGWDKIDQGSKLLSQHIPDNLYGQGADFGCGYGYLAHHLLSRPNKIKTLNVLDADYDALKCCTENLQKFDGVEIKPEWADLTVKYNGVPLDFIIMNPPFHQGKKMDSDLGQKFIITAANALKKNAALYMVANAHLPYEHLLASLFSKVEKLDEKQGFKVYKALK